MPLLSRLYGTVLLPAALLGKAEAPRLPGALPAELWAALSPCGSPGLGPRISALRGGLVLWSQDGSSHAPVARWAQPSPYRVAGAAPGAAEERVLAMETTQRGGVWRVRHKEHLVCILPWSRKIVLASVRWLISLIIKCLLATPLVLSLKTFSFSSIWNSWEFLNSFKFWALLSFQLTIPSLSHFSSLTFYHKQARVARPLLPHFASKLLQLNI